MVIYGMRFKCDEEGELWLRHDSDKGLQGDTEIARAECPLEDFEFLNTLNGELFEICELVALRGTNDEILH